MLHFIRNFIAVGILSLATLSLPAHSALQNRGSGLLYDDVLDVTWLQDANYAKTSGYDTDGMMSWATANLWVNNLTYFDVTRDTILTGWRLPAVRPVGVSFNYEWQLDGTSDEGYNIISPQSELSYMYYVNLGLKGSFSADGTYRSDFGVFGGPVAIWSGETDVGLVHNIQSNSYWAASGDTINDAWFFVMSEGNQRDGFPHPNSSYAWAVRSGDVLAAVPELESAAMFIAGLGLLLVVSRKRVLASSYSM